MFPNITETTSVIRLVNLLPASKLDRSIRKVIQLFQADLSRTPSLQEMAETAQVCPRQVERLFRKQTQLTPLQYLKRLRLEQAANLLVTEDWDVKKIGLEVGYKDASQFSAEFKRLYGKTPCQHREQSESEGE
jgi:transcriptional regulator GlxA family with amidase domain